MGFVGVLRVVRERLPVGNYFGKKKKDAACLFTDPDHGLVEQSYLPPFLPGIESAGKYDRNHGINRDGWGIAAYDDGRRNVVLKSRSKALLCETTTLIRTSGKRQKI